MKKSLFLTLMCLFAVLSAFVAPGGETARAAEKNNQNHTLGAEEITLVDSYTNLNTKLSSSTSETYLPSDRKWNGIATSVSYGDNLFVAWYTGGTKEPHPDNYIPVAASSDGGKTWKDPFMIIDPINSTSVVLPVFFVNGAGELFLYYSILPGSKMYAVKLIGADGPLSGITYEGPFKVSDRTGFVKPTILSDGSIIYVTGDDDDGYSGVYKSIDDGYNYTKIATIKSEYVKPQKTYTEASVVEREDGSLWMLSRLEKGYEGGIEQAFSYDKGVTWTTSTGKLPHPLNGPGARTAFIKLKSGAIVFVTNDSLTDRTNMTAYMSVDGGESWDYSLLLDRYVSAYPEIYQAPDGRILVAYDKGRYTENGIRLSIFTEEDLKAGEFVSGKSRDKMVVTKLNTNYEDIVSLKEDFKPVYNYPVGTASAVIRGLLPTTVTAIGDNGNEYVLTGTWKSAGYNKDAAGTYYLTFKTEMPETLLDSYELLRVKVVLQKDEKKGCRSAVGGDGLILSAIFVSSALIKGKKRSRRKNMKIKKLLIAFLAIFMITATGAGLAFAETGTERNSAQTETAEIVFADGAFKGVKYNGETAGGVYLGVKEGTVGRSEFLRLTAKFAEGINPNESTDLFITMGMPDFGGAFRLVVEDSEGGIWRMSHGATENFPFILDDGTVSTVKMSGNNYTFVAGKTGTLSVPWAKTFSAINSSGNFLTEGRKIVSVSICLTLGARSGGALWYSGLGVNFYALGTVKRGTDAETSEVKTLINANDCTFTADAEDTTADVNVAAVDKGKVFAIDGGLVNLSSVVKSGDENYDAIIAYGQIGRGDGLLTVNYKDKNGNAIKATDKTKVAYDMVNGYYAYEITAPEISDYEYESADKELIGSFSTVTEEITLTYKASEVPDADWDESTDNDVYKATFDENGFIKALDVKGDIDNCVYVGLKKNMTAASGMFSLVTVKLGEGADTSKSAGMFVKFMLPRNGYGFHFIVKDTAGNYYTAHKLNAGKDIFTIENAEEGVSLNASTQFKFKADAGTWFVPWGCFSSLADNSAMPAGTVVESASFALNLANAAWFGGYGVRFVSAGTVKTGVNKAKLVVLANGANATYADSAEDETKDVNVIDVTKGQLFYSNAAFNGSAVLTSGELYETAVNNVEAAVYPKMMPATLTVKYVDSNGTEIKESHMEKVDYDKAGGKYKYAITAPVIYDYDYVSADHALEGEFTETSFTVTLSYKLSEVPDTDWDESLDNDLYTATFNGDKLETFLVKKDTGSSVIFSIKKDLDDHDGLFSLFSIGFKSGAEVSKSSGLFVKLECSRNNYGFKFIITDENGRHYAGYGAKAAGNDLCTMEDGETTLSITSETQNVFFGKAGTWYVPWENFTDLETGAALDPSAKIVSCDIAMNLTKKAWFGGVGVKIAAVGTAKVGKGKMKAEVLADGTAATFTEDATDETKDVNIADVTKGQVFYSRTAFYKNQIITEGENLAIAIDAVEITPPSAEITLRLVDEKGRSVADDRIVTAVIGKNFTITPPTVMGYEYVSAIPSLTFEVTGSAAVTLKYKPREMTITLKFVDTEGNEIAASKAIKCKYKDIYTITADEISGYVFVESSRKLTGTCMADMTITLTYEKAGGCHGGLESTVGSIWLSGLAVLALGAITAISKKKKR